MTYEEYEKSYATLQWFEHVQGTLNARFYYALYEQYGSIAALCANQPEARERIDFHIKTLQLEVN